MSRCFVFVNIPAWVCQIWHDFIDQASLPGTKDLVRWTRTHRPHGVIPMGTQSTLKWHLSGSFEDIFVRTNAFDQEQYYYCWFRWDSFSSVQSLSHVRLFATPWTAARQASLSITNSRSLPKPMSIESVMPSNHLILCLLLLPSIFPSIRVFPMSQLFASGGQSIGVSASASVLAMITQNGSLLGWTGWISLQSKRLSRVFSNNSVQFSHSVVSDSLQLHELQHARPPCPSPTPKVYSDSCPLSQWCHPTTLSSVIPFSSRLQSFPA